MTYDPSTDPEIRDPFRDTREHVLAMRRAGVPVRRIALALDISTQRVYQLLAALKEEHRL